MKSIDEIDLKILRLLHENSMMTSRMVASCARGASIGEFIARGRKAVIVSMHEINAVRFVVEL